MDTLAAHAAQHDPDDEEAHPVDQRRSGPRRGRAGRGLVGRRQFRTSCQQSCRWSPTRRVFPYSNDPAATPHDAHCFSSGPRQCTTRASTARLPTHCPNCHRRPGNASSALQLAGELDILWLVLSPTTPARVTAARYCRGCVPHGPVTEIACSSCGDGPPAIWSLRRHGHSSRSAGLAECPWLALRRPRDCADFRTLWPVHRPRPLPAHM